METKVLRFNDQIIYEAAEHMAKGDVILLPSDNTYGLFANGENLSACERIYQLKQRAGRKPLGYYMSPQKAPEYGRFEIGSTKILGMWPCPITLIVPKTNRVPEYITKGFDSVLMVCPDEFCIKLNEIIDFPVACTSANKSGQESITSFEQAYREFNGSVPLIVDNGDSRHGQNGTIINFALEPPTVMRIGPYPADELKKEVPDLVMAEKMI